MAGTFNLGWGLAAYPSAVVSLRLGRKRTIMLSGFFAAVGVSIFSTSHAFVLLVLSLFLAGMGGGSYLPSSISMLTDHYPVKRRGLVLGIHATGASLGQLLGPLITAAFLFLGWNSVALIWLLIWLSFSLTFAFVVKEPGAEEPGNNVSKEQASARRWSLKQNAQATLTYMGALSAELGFLSLYPLYLTHTFSLQVQFIALLITVSRLAGLVGKVAVGYAADLFERRKIVTFFYLLAIVCMVLLSWLPFDGLLMIIFVAWGIATSSLWPVVFAVVSDHSVPAERSRKFGMLSTVGSIVAAGVMPILIGYLADAYGFSAAFLLPVIVSVVGLAAFLTLRFELATQTASHTPSH